MKWYLKVLRQYADFEGRAGRQEYWMFVLFNVIFSFAVSIIAAVMVATTGKSGGAFLAYLYMFAVILPGIAVTVRRLHDTGRSAWFLLVSLIPFIGGIWMLVLLVSEGTPGKNRYGDAPQREGDHTGFDRNKSVASALIVSSFAWLLAQLILCILFDWHYLRMLYFIIPAGLIITGFLLLRERKFTDNVAYSLIVTSVFWLVLELYSFQSVYLNMFLILKVLIMTVPAALLLLGISVLQKKDYNNTVAVLLIIGACAWIVSCILNLMMFGGVYRDVSDYILLLSSVMRIMTPVSMLVLAMSLLPKEAETWETGNKNVVKSGGAGGMQPVSVVSSQDQIKTAGQDVGGTNFYERDNKGMRVDTFSQSVAYWTVERFKNPRKDPFVYYVFKNEYDARAALLELPFIHTAADTKKLICDELFRFGYFAVTNNGQFTGEYDAFVAGSGFTHDLWQKTHAAFAKHHGVKRNDLEPEKNTTHNQPVAGNVKNVVFIREDRDNNSIWIVYKAPSKADAMAFLSQQQISRPLYYVIVETPEGNYGRDKDGFYQE